MHRLRQVAVCRFRFRWLAVVLAAVFGGLVRAADPGPLRVGLSTADITPEGPVVMRGFGARKRPSEGILRPIQAQCVVFDNGHTRVALMAFDLCAVSYSQLIRLRGLAEASGIPPQHLMVNASHSHYGPHLGSTQPHPQNLDYEALFTARTEPLLAAAVADLQPAVLDYAVGSCSMGINRRRVNPDGTCSGMRPEPRKPIDPEVPILRVRDAAGEVRALLFGYACHPTTLTGTTPTGFQVGTDYPGYARDWLAAAYPGAQPVFFQGCGGDIKPRAILADGRFGEVLLPPADLIASLGHELGRAVVAALAVPASPVPQDRPADLAAAAAAPVPLGGIVELVNLPSKEDPEKPCPTPFHMGVWRIGDVYLFGCQGELLSAVGQRIKNDLAGRRVWTSGYTHWGGGYLPDAASYAEGGYEVASSAFGPGAEAVVVATARRLVEALEAEPVHAEPIPVAAAPR